MSEVLSDSHIIEPKKNQILWKVLLQGALNAPGQLGNTYNRFYSYSYFNQIALALQGVNEPVATYKRWQEMDRQVLKGSRARSILRPIIFNEKNKLGEDERKVHGFKWVRCLFPLSETEGEELPPYEPPEWSRERAMASLAIQEIPFASLDGNTQGYSLGREFAVNPVAPYPLKTTIHEFGHIVLKHTIEDPERTQDEHRGIKEFQAEAIAYLTMNELGARDQMDQSESRAYIAGHLNGQTPDDAQIRRVFTATDTILKAGRLEPKEGTE